MDQEHAIAILKAMAAVSCADIRQELKEQILTNLSDILIFVSAPMSRTFKPVIHTREG